MRVLLLDVNCKYSSTGKIVYDLYTQLRRNGHEAAIGYGRGTLVREEYIYRFSPQWEVYIHALLTRITGYTGRYSPIATRRLIRIIKKFQPDVVHLNDMHGYFVNIIPLVEYLKKSKIKTVWTFHCEFMYTGKCGHSYECTQWQEKCYKCPRLKDYPQSWFWDKTEKMFMEKKNAFENFSDLVIVSPSKWLANRIRLSFFKDKDIRVIYNGIDTSIFRRKDVAKLRKQLQLNNKKIILAVAPNIMSKNKGGNYVIKLAERMPEQYFIMIGVSEKNLTTPDNVKTIENIKDQNLLSLYYSLADVFIICSERENYPTTCIEAAACGAPIVGFDVGGTAETVVEENGIFVPYGNIDALQKGVERFLKGDRELLTDKRDYSKERMFKEYLKLYEDICRK